MKILTFIVLALGVCGLAAQEVRPRFTSPEQLEAERQAAKPNLVGMKLWFVPVPDSSRRTCFSRNAFVVGIPRIDDIVPTSIVQLTILERVVDRSSGLVHLKIQFTDGPIAYVSSTDLELHVKTVTPEQIVEAAPFEVKSALEALVKPGRFACDSFYTTDPALLLERVAVVRDLEELHKRQAEESRKVEQAKIAAKEKKAAAAWKARGGVTIGMTQAQALASNWGKPRKVNRTVRAGVVHEQWVYGGGYLYFDNGILTSYQN